jgi:hypothetical protein
VKGIPRDALMVKAEPRDSPAVKINTISQAKHAASPSFYLHKHSAQIVLLDRTAQNPNTTPHRQRKRRYTTTMTIPQLRKAKHQMRLGFDPAKTVAVNLSHLPNSSSPSFPKPAAGPASSLSNLDYETYKAAKLNVAQKYDLIGHIRDEIPLVEREEIDNMVLADVAKQLELSVFPMCKMMHIDDKAVKRMLNEQFTKAYGVEVEEEIHEQANTERMVHAEQTVTVDGADIVTVADANVRDESEAGDHASGVDIMVSVERTVKKVKRAHTSAVQKEIKAYQAKARRGKKACLVVTLRAKAVTDKWVGLTTESV